MREIIFRGKRLDNGEWAEGYLYEHEPALVGIASENDEPEPSKWFIERTGFADWNMPRPVEFVEVDPSTVGQYTGLKDKHGKRIFEGDVVTGMVHGPGIWTGQVIWIDRIAGFGLKWIHRDAPTAFENCSLLRLLTSQGGHPGEYLAEIIGNIHDNPELIYKE